MVNKGTLIWHNKHTTSRLQRCPLFWHSLVSLTEDRGGRWLVQFYWSRNRYNFLKKRKNTHGGKKIRKFQSCHRQRYTNTSLFLGLVWHTYPNLVIETCRHYWDGEHLKGPRFNKGTQMKLFQKTRL